LREALVVGCHPLLNTGIVHHNRPKDEPHDGVASGARCQTITAPLASIPIEMPRNHDVTRCARPARERLRALRA